MKHRARLHENCGRKEDKVRQQTRFETAQQKKIFLTHSIRTTCLRLHTYIFAVKICWAIEMNENRE